MHHAELSTRWRRQEFDFVFMGAGCASLSLLMHMIKSGRFTDKKILLIDKSPKDKNDRTWCFWEKEKGFFEEIIYKSWDHLDFFSESFSGPMNIAPYRYKMIRGIDFYEYCFHETGKHPGIQIIYGDITGYHLQPDGLSIIIDNEPWHAGNAIVFNSVYKPAAKAERTINLLQHFKGWIIETPTAAFNPFRGTLMDFRVHQQEGASFIYVLPFSETKALIEYTLFTGRLLDKQQYEEELKNYIHHFLQIGQYKVSEEEFGIIPMTNEKFSFFRDGVFHIGTAGGQTKASSGYTFRFIQKQSQLITDCLVKGKPLEAAGTAAKRFGFYDTVLLRLLEEGKPGGSEIFSRLFQRNNAAAVFKFLDNETSIIEELKIILTLPTLPFLKAAFAPLNL
jgi:lycopene beta-cyclase